MIKIGQNKWRDGQIFNESTYRGLPLAHSHTYLSKSIFILNYTSTVAHGNIFILKKKINIKFF